MEQSSSIQLQYEALKSVDQCEFFIMSNSYYIISHVYKLQKLFYLRITKKCWIVRSDNQSDN